MQKKIKLSNIDITLPLWKNDLLREIFMFSTVKSLLNFRITCKTFLKITQLMVLSHDHISQFNRGIIQIFRLQKIGVNHSRDITHFLNYKYLSTLKELIVNEEYTRLFFDKCKPGKLMNQLQSIELLKLGLNYIKGYGSLVTEFVNGLPTHENLTLYLHWDSSVKLPTDFLAGIKIRRLKIKVYFIKSDFKKYDPQHLTFLSTICASKLEVTTNSSKYILDHIIKNKSITSLLLKVGESFFNYNTWESWDIGLGNNYSSVWNYNISDIYRVYEKLSKYIKDNGIDLLLEIECKDTTLIVQLIEHLESFILPLGAKFLKKLLLIIKIDHNMTVKALSKVQKLAEDFKNSPMDYNLEVNLPCVCCIWLMQNNINCKSIKYSPNFNNGF